MAERGRSSWIPKRRRGQTARAAAGERWTVHAVRGLVDTASPLGARWISDEACDDEFSREVVEAQRALFRDVDTPWPDGGPVPVRMLAGAGRTPSLVWHAQAIGVLLELGFLPTARCIREHLDVIERRLDPVNCHDPEKHPEDDGWLLRTRHVAWVVACLAEMPQFDLAPGESSELRRDLEQAMQQHRRIIRTAASYLLGIGDEGPATWVGLRDSEQVWSEVWQEREPNFLNTVYACLALCRAERHGYLGEIVGPHSGLVSRATELFGPLFQDLVVETSSSGPPTVHWRRRWREPWARHDLPSGVIALLVLALAEYSGLLLEASFPGSEEEMRALAARTRAQRLAHVLVSRNRRDETSWSTSADAFFSEKAEGAWFTPTYSLGLRAILETGVVHPLDPQIVRGFETIGQLATERRHAGSVTQAWLDPTRAPRMREEEGGLRQHAVADFGGEGNAINRQGRADAAGLHAACMAWAGLRRAAARLDPRELLWQPRVEPPPSPFEVIEVSPHRASWRLKLVGDGGLHAYTETSRIVTETLHFLRALDSFDAPATAGDIAAEVARLAGASQPPLQPASVGHKIWHINRQFATSLIASTDDGRHFLTARLRVADPASVA